MAKGSSLDSYLKASRFCNPEHPEVLRKARQLAEGLKDKREAAVQVFRWVRDSIRWYPFPQRLLPAQEVLKLTHAPCYNKANLQVALFRSLGIPARYHYQKVDMEFYLRALPRGEVRSLMAKVHPPVVITVFAEAYLGGKWISASATFDRAYSPERAKDWDGKTSVTPFKPEEVVEDLGVSHELKKPEMEELWRKMDEETFRLMRLLDEALKLYTDLRRFTVEVEERLGLLLREASSRRP